MLNPFAWIRTQAREALIGGIADGLSIVTPDGVAPPVNLDELRAQLAAAVVPKSLPAPALEAEEPATKKRR